MVGKTPHIDKLCALSVEGGSRNVVSVHVWNSLIILAPLPVLSRTRSPRGTVGSLPLVVDSQIRSPPSQQFYVDSVTATE